MIVQTSEETDLPPTLAAAVKGFDEWSHAQLLVADEINKIESPLFHYTNAVGLDGIIKAQQIWFTSYRHLNDPSELEFGMKVASKILQEARATVDKRVGLFCDIVLDLFTHDNVKATLSFFVASFSRTQDDLGQWRAYGDNGCGFCLGLAPHLFHVIEETSERPHEKVFVMPVVYGEFEGRKRHHQAIEMAIRTVADAIESDADLFRDRAVGLSFFRRMAESLIGSQMLWNSLTIKHDAYSHEREVRLVILGDHDSLSPYISTRPSGARIVPYIKHDMPIQKKDSIFQIMVGPAAADSAEDAIESLLRPFGGNRSDLVSRSSIPYRAVS